MVSDTTIEGFILITVPKNIPAVIEKLDRDPIATQYIEEMALLFGGADIFAKIKVPSVEALHNLVIETIQKMPEVATTQTYIISPKAKTGITQRVND